MRELTFCGFLERYLRELSFSKSLNIFKLVKEAKSENPRLREPLLIYSVCKGKKEILLRALKKYNLEEYFADILSLNDTEFFEKLKNGSLSNEYNKVWNSFNSVKNKNKTDNMTKQMIRNRILKIKEKQNISNYSIYKNIKCNPGNINAWIKNGDESKVSLDVARKALDYLMNTK